MIVAFKIDYPQSKQNEEIAVPVIASLKTLVKVSTWALAAACLPAQALQIISLSPQGEVSRIRQVVAKFDDSAVNFGDPKAPAPLSLTGSATVNGLSSLRTTCRQASVAACRCVQASNHPLARSWWV